ncbi:uncharacterized protein LOC128179333 [Crassostrea angulata]|uniref:uncharacterized protein LOC128179333 n=1 Tax=Magallana angulata TaxID=2784310 RepID=UPI0022B1B39E|nr:uncharacterized protein LOC128179333 [Crassostrea angulata]
MESLKVLVVLLAVFHGSLSRPQDDDELRAVVENLRRLVERKMNDMGDKPSPPGPSVPGPRRPKKMLMTFIDNYYGDFPGGNYTWGTPVDMNSLVDIYTWFKNADISSTPMFQSPAFSKMLTKFLDSYFRCAAMKINQMAFYILQEQETAMAAEKDNTMYTEIRRILEAELTDPSAITMEIVKKSFAHTYDTIMLKVKHFQMRGMGKIFRKMRMFMKKAVRKGWTVEELKSNFLKLMETADFYKCPDEGDLREYHKKISVYFQRRFSKRKPFAKAEAWLTNFLREHVKDPATVVQGILGVYRGYVTAAVGVFQEVEKHMITGDAEDILNFVSQFLTEDQLSYLKAIFRDLGGSDENDDDDFEGSGSPDDDDDLYPGGTGSPDDLYPGGTGSPDDLYPGGTGSPDDLYPGGTGSPDDLYPGGTGSPDDLYPGGTGSPDDLFPGGTGSPDDLYPGGTGSVDYLPKRTILKEDGVFSEDDDKFSEN